jgi:hypothetical protein
MPIGDKLGLYKALAKGGPMTAADLAGSTGTAEHYEWLAAQAASDCVTCDAATAKVAMPPEQPMAVADEYGPALIGALGDPVAAAILDEPASFRGIQSIRR